MRKPTPAPPAPLQCLPWFVRKDRLHSRPTELLTPSQDPAPDDPDATLSDDPAPEGPKIRRSITRAHQEFITAYADTGFSDPDRAAKAAGFKTPRIGWDLVERHRDLIDRERARRSLGQAATVDEALVAIGEVVRDQSDPKTRLAAARTVLEMHGLLGRDKTPVDDKKKLIREVEAIGEQIRRLRGLGMLPMGLASAPGADPSDSEAIEPEIMGAGAGEPRD